MTERERGFAKWADSVPKCIGYPTCDGDLVGTVHEDECPMSKVENSAGKAFAATYYDCWQAAFEAGRGGWVSVESVPRDGTMILVDFGRIGVHAVSWTEAQHGAKGWCVDDLKFGPYALRSYIETDVKGWMPLPLPAPPDSGDYSCAATFTPVDARDSTIHDLRKQVESLGKEAKRDGD